MKKIFSQNRRYSGSRISFFITGLVVSSVLFSLGVWQVQRMYWKEALILKIQERLSSPARSIQEIEKQLSLTGDVDYEPVRVEGALLHQREKYLFTVEKGQPGFHVYAPMRLTDGRFLLVNSGFLPHSMKAQKKKEESIKEEKIIIKGIARNILKEKPSFFIPDNDLLKNIFYWKDYFAMKKKDDFSEKEDFLMFFVDAQHMDQNSETYSINVEPPQIHNNHLQYVMTWFSLGIIWLTIWFFRYKTLSRI